MSKVDAKYIEKNQRKNYVLTKKEDTSAIPRSPTKSKIPILKKFHHAEPSRADNELKSPVGYENSTLLASRLAKAEDDLKTAESIIKTMSNSTTKERELKYEAEISELAKRYQSAMLQIANKDEFIEKLQEKLNVFNQGMEMVLGQKIDFQLATTSQDLFAQLQELNARKLREINPIDDQELHSQKLLIDRLQSECINHEKLLLEKDSQLEYLNDAITNLTDLNQELFNELQNEQLAHKEQIEDKNAKLEAINDSFNEMKEELQLIYQSKNEFEKKYTEIRTVILPEVEDLKSKLSKSEKELQKMQENYTHSKAELENLQRILESERKSHIMEEIRTRGDLQALREELKSCCQKNSSLESQLLLKNEQIKSLEQENIAVDAEALKQYIDDDNIDFDKLPDTIPMKQKLLICQKQLERNKSLNHDLLMAKTTSIDAMKRFFKQLQFLKCMVQMNIRNIRASNLYKKSKESLSESNSKKLSSSKTELNDRYDATKELESKLRYKEVQISQLEKQIVDLQEEIAEISEKSQDYENLKLEYTMLRDQKTKDVLQRNEMLENELLKLKEQMRTRLQEYYSEMRSISVQSLENEENLDKKLFQVQQKCVQSIASQQKEIMRLTKENLGNLLKLERKKQEMNSQMQHYQNIQNQNDAQISKLHLELHENAKKYSATLNNMQDNWNEEKTSLQSCIALYETKIQQLTLLISEEREIHQNATSQMEKKLEEADQLLQKELRGLINEKEAISKKLRLEIVELTTRLKYLENDMSKILCVQELKDQEIEELKNSIQEIIIEERTKVVDLSEKLEAQEENCMHYRNSFYSIKSTLDAALLKLDALDGWIKIASEEYQFNGSQTNLNEKESTKENNQGGSVFDSSDMIESPIIKQTSDIEEKLQKIISRFSSLIDTCSKQQTSLQMAQAKQLELEHQIQKQKMNHENFQSKTKAEFDLMEEAYYHKEMRYKNLELMFKMLEKVLLKLKQTTRRSSVHDLISLDEETVDDQGEQFAIITELSQHISRLQTELGNSKKAVDAFMELEKENYTLKDEFKKKGTLLREISEDHFELASKNWSLSKRLNEHEVLISQLQNQIKLLNPDLPSDTNNTHKSELNFITEMDSFISRGQTSKDSILSLRDHPLPLNQVLHHSMEEIDEKQTRIFENIENYSGKVMEFGQRLEEKNEEIRQLTIDVQDLTRTKNETDEKFYEKEQEIAKIANLLDIEINLMQESDAQYQNGNEKSNLQEKLKGSTDIAGKNMEYTNLRKLVDMFKNEIKRLNNNKDDFEYQYTRLVKEKTELIESHVLELAEFKKKEEYYDSQRKFINEKVTALQSELQSLFQAVEQKDFTKKTSDEIKNLLKELESERALKTDVQNRNRILETRLEEFTNKLEAMGDFSKNTCEQGKIILTDSLAQVFETYEENMNQREKELAERDALLHEFKNRNQILEDKLQVLHKELIELQETSKTTKKGQRKSFLAKFFHNGKANSSSKRKSRENSLDLVSSLKERNSYLESQVENLSKRLNEMLESPNQNDKVLLKKSFMDVFESYKENIQQREKIAIELESKNQILKEKVEELSRQLAIFQLNAQTDDKMVIQEECSDQRAPDLDLKERIQAIGSQLSELSQILKNAIPEFDSLPRIQEKPDIIQEAQLEVSNRKAIRESKLEVSNQTIELVERLINIEQRQVLQEADFDLNSLILDVYYMFGKTQELTTIKTGSNILN